MYIKQDFGHRKRNNGPDHELLPPLQPVFATALLLLEFALQRCGAGLALCRICSHARARA